MCVHASTYETTTVHLSSASRVHLTPDAAPLEPVLCWLFDRPKPGFFPSTALWPHVVRVSVRCCHHLRVDFEVCSINRPTMSRSLWGSAFHKQWRRVHVACYWWKRSASTTKTKLQQQHCHCHHQNETEAAAPLLPPPKRNWSSSAVAATTKTKLQQQCRHCHHQNLKDLQQHYRCHHQTFRRKIKKEKAPHEAAPNPSVPFPSRYDELRAFAQPEAKVKSIRRIVCINIHTTRSQSKVDTTSSSSASNSKPK